MTTETEPQLAAAATTIPTANSLQGYVSAYLSRIRGGDMGSLPAVAALVVLALVFSVIDSGFFSLSNLSNLTTQAAPGVLLAMGLVFVLLLGEIDLSAGTTSGVGAATIAVLLSKGWSWPFALLVALIVGAVIGLFIGWMRTKVRVPSFVVTLALFLAFQGVVIMLVNVGGNTGSMSLNSNAMQAIENKLMPVWLSWVFALVCIALFAVDKLMSVRTRRKKGLAAEPAAVTGLKIGGVAVVALLFTYLSCLNQNSGAAPGISQTPDGKLVQVAAPTLAGIPWVVPIIVALVAVLGFVLSRTRYGRHVYAVGGNDEAARRAGIRVDAIRVSVFVICSCLAVISGLVLASQYGVSQQTGGGNTLLLAVGAAVVGGTSLFGGKGKITDAVIGGLVVAVIINGMSDLIHGKNNAAWQAVVTGVVLLLAATVDALSRRRAGSTGLG